MRTARGEGLDSQRPVLNIERSLVSRVMSRQVV
jgi:hypothetical protein